MIVVGENSYIDVTEADRLIASRYMSRSKEKKFWDSLSNEDKECLIISATEKYDTDNMLFKGRKALAIQKLQFPRFDKLGVLVQVPDKVLVCYLLMGIYDCIIGDSNEAYLQLSGVKSFADGSGARIESGSDSTMSNEFVKNSLGIYNGVFNKYIKEFTDIV